MVDGVRPASLAVAVKMPKAGRRGHWTVAMAVPLALLLAPPAHASDYSLLPAVLYGVFGAVFAAVFAMTWLMTKPMTRRWLRLLLRCFVVAAFWAPVNLGTSASPAWWPACCSFLDFGRATEAPASIVATTLLLWILCNFRPKPDGPAGREDT